MKNKSTPEEILGGVMLAIIFVCATFQVINRFILHISAPWTEEACRYAFIWIALIGIANGVKKNSHLNVDLIDKVLPPRAKQILGIILDIIFFALMVYMFKISVDYLMKVAKFGTTSVGLGIKMWIVYLILPIFSGMTMIRIIEKYIRKLCKPKKEGNEE